MVKYDIKKKSDRISRLKNHNLIRFLMIIPTRHTQNRLTDTVSKGLTNVIYDGLVRTKTTTTTTFQHYSTYSNQSNRHHFRKLNQCNIWRAGMRNNYYSHTFTTFFMVILPTWHTQNRLTDTISEGLSNVIYEGADKRNLMMIILFSGVWTSKWQIKIIWIHKHIKTHMTQDKVTFTYPKEVQRLINQKSKANKKTQQHKKTE